MTANSGRYASAYITNRPDRACRKGLRVEYAALETGSLVAGGKMSALDLTSPDGYVEWTRSPQGNNMMLWFPGIKRYRGVSTGWN